MTWVELPVMTVVWSPAKQVLVESSNRSWFSELVLGSEQISVLIDERALLSLVCPAFM